MRHANYIARLVNAKGAHVDFAIPTTPLAISFKGRIFRPRLGYWPDLKFVCWYDERPTLIADDILLTVNDEDVAPPEDTAALITYDETPLPSAQDETAEAA
jgi:hypothetical protein